VDGVTNRAKKKKTIKGKVQEGIKQQTRGIGRGKNQGERGD